MELIEHLRLVPSLPNVKSLPYLLDTLEAQYKYVGNWNKGKPNATLRANKGVLLQLYQKSLLN